MAGAMVMPGMGGMAAAGKVAMPAPNSSFVPGANSGQVARNTTAFTPTAPTSPASAPPGAGAPAPGPQQSALAALQSDPAYAAAANDATANAASAAAARTQSIQQLAEQYGGIPAGFKDAYGDVTPTVQGIASNNPFSEIAQQDRSYNQGVTGDEMSLGSRGMLNSGALPAVQGQDDYNQGLALYNLANSFSSAANTAIGNYTGALATNKTNLANALQTAEKDQSTNPANVAVTNPPAPAKPVTPAAPSTPKAFVPSEHPKITLTPLSVSRSGQSARNTTGFGS